MLASVEIVCNCDLIQDRECMGLQCGVVQV